MNLMMGKPAVVYSGQKVNTMKLLGDVVQGSIEDQNLTITSFQKAGLEVSGYNREAATKFNPLPWWKEHAQVSYFI